MGGYPVQFGHNCMDCIHNLYPTFEAENVKRWRVQIHAVFETAWSQTNKTPRMDFLRTRFSFLDNAWKVPRLTLSEYPHSVSVLSVVYSNRSSLESSLFKEDPFCFPSFSFRFFSLHPNSLKLRNHISFTSC